MKSEPDYVSRYMNREDSTVLYFEANGKKAFGILELVGFNSGEQMYCARIGYYQNSLFGPRFRPVPLSEREHVGRFWYPFVNIMKESGLGGELKELSFLK